MNLLKNLFYSETDEDLAVGGIDPGPNPINRSGIVGAPRYSYVDGVFIIAKLTEKTQGGFISKVNRLSKLYQTQEDGRKKLKFKFIQCNVLPSDLVMLLETIGEITFDSCAMTELPVFPNAKYINLIDCRWLEGFDNALNLFQPGAKFYKLKTLYVRNCINFKVTGIYGKGFINFTSPEANRIEIEEERGVKEIQLETCPRWLRNKITIKKYKRGALKKPEYDSDSDSDTDSVIEF